MRLPTELQPDQQPAQWDDHVAVYEQVLEPLTNVFAARTLDLLDFDRGDRLSESSGWRRAGSCRRRAGFPIGWRSRWAWRRRWMRSRPIGRAGAGRLRRRARARPGARGGGAVRGGPRRAGNQAPDRVARSLPRGAARADEHVMIYGTILKPDGARPRVNTPATRRSEAPSESRRGSRAEKPA